MSKLPKKPSALKKRGNPKLQNMNFTNIFLLLWVIFALLDPDPDPLARLNPDPDPKPALLATQIQGSSPIP
jgi:hypothetical protein